MVSSLDTHDAKLIAFILAVLYVPLAVIFLIIGQVRGILREHMIFSLMNKTLDVLLPRLLAPSIPGHPHPEAELNPGRSPSVPLKSSSQASADLDPSLPPSQRRAVCEAITALANLFAAATHTQQQPPENRVVHDQLRLPLSPRRLQDPNP